MSELTYSARSDKDGWDYLPEFVSEQLPRFTSYPPANRISGDIDAANASSARPRLSADAAISLYRHIPFCQKLCGYCGCHTTVPTLADRVDTCIQALKA